MLFVDFDKTEVVLKIINIIRLIKKTKMNKLDVKFNFIETQALLLISMKRDKLITS